jgi:hypothetical protein
MTEWNGIKVGGLYKMSGHEAWADTEYLPRALLLMVVGIEPPLTDGGWGSRARVTLLASGAEVVVARSCGHHSAYTSDECSFDFQSGDWSGEWSRYKEVA